MSLSIGIDLAQARDRTALAAVASWRGEPVENAKGRKRRPLEHDLIALDRLRPGIPYPQQAEMITAFAETLDCDERPVLFVDATGVGRPVLDLLRQGCPFPVNGVTITPGATVTRNGQDFAVPKTDLVGCLEVALSTRRLHAAPDLTLAKELGKEMRAFSYEMSATGRPKYEGRGAHDDLVTALALGVWGAERGAGPAAAFVDMMRADIGRRTESEGVAL
ncbi:MAG TPA: hypothetical protein VNF71_07020 [Acidimicrobiales bacterium]|nr:hypothetical protein [Acidimicrobiales bacterium]